MQKALVLAVLAAVSIFADAQHQAQKVHRVVIDMNVPGPPAWQDVLENTAHIRQDFQPEPVEVEVVCRGSAIGMLLDGNNSVTRNVEAAMHTGTTFVACGESLAGLSIPASRLIKGVTVAKSGAVHVVRREELGWSYLKGSY